MPNHIQNRIKIVTTEKVELVLNAIKGEGKIDFNKIIPQPENIFLGNLSLEDEKRCEREGRPTWYRWNIDNWGTKWGAYALDDKRDSDDTIHFQTAWSVPEPIVEKLAKMFPDVEMHWDYADEDSGYNTGRIILKDGSTYWNNPEGGSIESYEIYFDLNPDDRNDYELVDGKYQYKDQD